MNNKHFIQLRTHGNQMKYISLSSIALVEDLFTNGTQITLKEKDANGNNITFAVAMRYVDVTVEINRLVSLP